MNTVGVFAGRGDVILMMLLCLFIGFVAGIKTNSIYLNIVARWNKWKNRKNNPTVA